MLPELSMRWSVIVAGLVISLGTRVAPLGAQSRVWVGAGAGIAVPSGVLRDEANPGWRALAALDLGLPDLPANLRVDATYDRFGFKSAPAGSSGNETGARTVGSVSIGLSIGSSDSLRRVAPYALGGVVMSHVGCTGRSGCDVDNQMGWTAGLGARFVAFGLRGFTEARMHCVVQALSDLCHVPITVGVLLWSHDGNAVEPASDDR